MALREIWPVKSSELKKVLPLLYLKFLVSLVYSTLTCLKDSLVVTANQSGAEVIPILKGWVVFPLSLLCAIGYSKLSNHYKRSTLFYSIIIFFMVLIFLYGFYLYPNAQLISPNASADLLTLKLGSKFSHWISVYRNWIHSLFFICSELWGQVVIFILYWGFTNHVCQVKEAKRMYHLFIAAGDVATIACGPLVLHYVQKFSNTHFAFALQSLVLYVLGAGMLIILTFWWLNKYALHDTKSTGASSTQLSLDQKTKLTIAKSIKHIFSSKYLMSIAVMVIGCALTINLVEVTWKSHVKTLFPSPSEYAAFQSKITPITGLVALFTVLFLGGNLLKRFGWLFSALITPIVIGTTGTIFFIFTYNKD